MYFRHIGTAQPSPRKTFRSQSNSHSGSYNGKKVTENTKLLRQQVEVHLDDKYKSATTLSDRIKDFEPSKVQNGESVQLSLHHSDHKNPLVENGTISSCKNEGNV